MVLVLPAAVAPTGRSNAPAPPPSLAPPPLLFIESGGKSRAGRGEFLGSEFDARLVQRNRRVPGRVPEKSREKTRPKNARGALLRERTLEIELDFEVGRCGGIQTFLDQIIETELRSG